MAATLPAETAGALVSAARNAFVAGLQVAAVSGALVMVVSAIVVAIVLHGARIRASADEVEAAEAPAAEPDRLAA